MSITYTWGTPLVRPREESEKVSDGARGLVSKEEIDVIIDRQKPTPHIVIQIMAGAYTDAEWAALADSIEGVPTGKTKLPVPDYGTKWRAWYGDPTPEQMEVPWDMIPGGDG